MPKLKQQQPIDPHPLVKLLIPLFGICMALFVLELAARFLPPPYAAGEGDTLTFLGETEIFECNSDMGWTGATNLHETIELTGSFRTNLSFNSLGFHDTEHSSEKAPGTYRIVMLGDSFVHAIQVDETATSHQVLEDLLNKNAPGDSMSVDVISGGVGGWGTSQALINYRERWRHFEPDVVLLMFYLGNDFEDNLPGRVHTIGGYNCYAPYFSVCRDQLNPYPLTYVPGISQRKNSCTPLNRFFINSMGWLYQNSHLYQQLDPLLPHRHRQLGTTYPGPYWALYIPNNDPEVEQAWQVTQALLVQLNQEVQADGAKFAVAFFPTDLFIEFAALPPSAQEALKQDNPDFTEFEPDRPNRRLAEFLQSRNIPFIDLTAPLINERTKGTQISLPIDGHWTVEGNRIVAETLASWLAEQELLAE